MPDLDLVCICDWLPPDFGAVGQYSLMSATERGRAGAGGRLGRPVEHRRQSSRPGASARAA